ncbi:1,6-dihydroxycyclohexa-2,4-diene-1-carboxylate dehydrogenase [Micrococcales bacterium 31B]|nr:1,6-dihydroxycyclohexa-2,4-diene-1-carboxylate dehydrogenase [Micrococcales bacterium 31B]
MGAPYDGRFVTAGRFADKIAVVTGAAQGIGQRVAERIAAEGGTVVLVDRAEIVHDTAREIRERSGEAAASAVVADLETAAGAREAIAAALDRHGRVDVLVNNVGGTIWARPYAEYDDDKIEREIRRSLFPTLWTCHAVLPAMLERGAGTIVNVSSVATRGMHRVPYAAAKGGINALTQSLAMEVAERGIRVVATAPGGTEAPPRKVLRGPQAESETERDWYQTIVDQTVESSFMKRYGTLDEQAAPIVFMASDEASYVTGTVLPVAGGDLG